MDAPLPTMHAIARIGLVVGYCRRVFIAKDPQWTSRKKQENLTIPAENSLPRPRTPFLQSPSTAPVGPILLKFWLKTRKLILNSHKVFNPHATVSQSPYASSELELHLPY